MFGGNLHWLQSICGVQNTDFKSPTANGRRQTQIRTRLPIWTVNSTQSPRIGKKNIVAFPISEKIVVGLARYILRHLQCLQPSLGDLKISSWSIQIGLNHQCCFLLIVILLNYRLKLWYSFFRNFLPQLGSLCLQAF